MKLVPHIVRGSVTALVAGMAIHPVDAATWEVYPDGSGDFELVSQALLGSGPGDTILIAPGFYEEDLPFVLVEDKPLYIRGTGASPGATTLTGVPIFFRRGSGTVVENLRFLNNPWSIIASDGAYALLRCVFEGNTGSLCSAVYAAAYSETDSLLVDGCGFYRNTSSSETCFGAALNVSATPAVVRHSVFVDNETANAGAGILVSETERGTVTDRCVFVGNRAFNGPAMSTLGGSSFLMIRYCTFWDNHSTGGGGAIYLDAMSWWIENCIIGGTVNGWGLVALGPGEVHCTNFWANDRGSQAGGGCYTCSPSYGNIAMDPMFCDPDSGNFHLQPGSPCLPGYHEGVYCDGMGAYGGDCSATASTDGPGGEMPRLGDPSIVRDGLGLTIAPNPTLGPVAIELSLLEPARVAIDVYDVSGKKVLRVGAESLPAGAHRFWIDQGSEAQLPRGVYYVVARSGIRSVALPFVVVARD